MGSVVCAENSRACTSLLESHCSSDLQKAGARCSSMVRGFAHGVMGRQIDPSWCGPIELFLVPASAP